MFDLRYHVASLAAVFLALVDRDPRRRRHLRPRRSRGARCGATDRQRATASSTRRTGKSAFARAPAEGDPGLRRRQLPGADGAAASTASASRSSSSARSTTTCAPASSRTLGDAGGDGRLHARAEAAGRPQDDAVARSPTAASSSPATPATTGSASSARASAGARRGRRRRRSGTPSARARRGADAASRRRPTASSSSAHRRRRSAAPTGRFLEASTPGSARRASRPSASRVGRVDDRASPSCAPRGLSTVDDVEHADRPARARAAARGRPRRAATASARRTTRLLPPIEPCRCG